MFDVIVIGARCGGAPTAMLLARRGYKVLLVDRDTFPSDIPHGHFIHRQGPPLLQKWGLLDRLVRAGCPPVFTFTMDAGDFPLTGERLELEGVAVGYGPRRRLLDQLLIEAACESGAEFRPNYTVEGFLSEDGSIAGTRGRCRRSGRTSEDRARITVGAPTAGTRS
jgi:flavin-dependent dehydrogenase